MFNTSMSNLHKWTMVKDSSWISRALRSQVSETQSLLSEPICSQPFLWFWNNLWIGCSLPSLFHQLWCWVNSTYLCVWSLDWQTKLIAFGLVHFIITFCFFIIWLVWAREVCCFFERNQKLSRPCSLFEFFSSRSSFQRKWWNWLWHSIFHFFCVWGFRLQSEIPRGPSGVCLWRTYWFHPVFTSVVSSKQVISQPFSSCSFSAKHEA